MGRGAGALCQGSSSVLHSGKALDRNLSLCDDTWIFASNSGIFARPQTERATQPSSSLSATGLNAVPLDLLAGHLFPIVNAPQYRSPPTLDLGSNRLLLFATPDPQVAFVGRSRAGQSTIVSLIQRFYDPLT